MESANPQSSYVYFAQNKHYDSVLSNMVLSAFT